MSASEAEVLEAVKHAAKSATMLQMAVLAGDELRCFELLREVMRFDANHIEHHASSEEAKVRCMAHEVADAALRQVVLADGGAGQTWKLLVLPSKLGVMARAPWMSNARWLRLNGSDLPDTNDERLEAAALSRLGFADQGRALGRYCVVNDGAREVDIEAVLAALDARLKPFFVDWVLGVYCVSPAGILGDTLEARQNQAMFDLARLRPGSKGTPLAASPLALGALYDSAYRHDESLRDGARWISGTLSRRIFEQFRTHGEKVPPTDEVTAGLALAEDSGALVVCPNWRDNHVAYRCMAPLLEGLREEGAAVCMPHAKGAAAAERFAADWRDQSFEVHFESEHHFLVDSVHLADAIGNKRLDFLFYPEVTPSNSTSWLATQRLARVQAAGYGVPVTSGSPQLDYFIGGAEVEAPGAERHYSEQLVLLPGFGVSTTPPPLPTIQRSRPADDAELRLVSTATHRKLSVAMLESWSAILQAQPHARLDLFPAMLPRDVERLAPAMAGALGDVPVDLHPYVERSKILDTLVEADLYLDTYPFGGFNSLVEVLSCGCPIVTFEGNQARNRFGAAMLRRVGLPDFLIARTHSDYIAAATRVLNDPGLRSELRARLADRERVLALLADPDMAAHFDAARQWMLERGPRAGRPSAPVMMRAGDRPTVLSA
ncbi:MAG: hypothetical protein P1V81_12495 [Planctomycetota bacterium]|nr:hypothetical protein [Planctomycetota bacterium]